MKVQIARIVFCLLIYSMKDDTSGSTVEGEALLLHEREKGVASANYGSLGVGSGATSVDKTSISKMPLDIPLFTFDLGDSDRERESCGYSSSCSQD